MPQPMRSSPNFENPLCIQLLCGFGTKLFMAKLQGLPVTAVVSTVTEYIDATPMCTEDAVRNALDELASNGLCVKIGDEEYTPTPAGIELSCRLSA